MYSIMCVYMHHICIYNVYVYIFVVYFPQLSFFYDFGGVYVLFQMYIFTLLHNIMPETLILSCVSTRLSVRQFRNSNVSQFYRKQKKSPFIYIIFLVLADLVKPTKSSNKRGFSSKQTVCKNIIWLS